MDKKLINILIVNDNHDLRSIIRDYLRAEGYSKIIVSENGMSALRKAVAEPPDLIIAAYETQGLNGLELLKEIRKTGPLKDLPFIMLSNETSQKYVARAAEEGVSAYLVVPFTHQVLADKVNQLLERRLNPNEADALSRDADQTADSGDLDAALKKYQALLSLTQNALAVVYYKVGQVHEMMDQEGEAEENYHLAIDMSSLYVNAYDALGSLNLKRTEAQEALKYFRHSTNISPLNAGRQLKLGEALLETGQFEDAEKAFKQSLDLDPSQTHIFNHLGISLRRQGKLEEAGRYFLQAVEASGDDENLLYNLSRVYMDQGEREAALSYLKKALAINPDFQAARDMLARVGT